MVQPFWRIKWISAWHKVTHTGNYNKQWWNTHIVQILGEIRDGNFFLKSKFLSGITKPVELSHYWIKTILKYQDPEFYSRLFDESKNGPFEVLPVCKKIYGWKISTWCSYVVCFTTNNSACVICSFSSDFSSLVIKLLRVFKGWHYTLANGKL